jgi:hypothetical protein
LHNAAPSSHFNSQRPAQSHQNNKCQEAADRDSKLIMT